MNVNGTNAMSMNEVSRTKILVVDDEADIATLLSIHLRVRGYQPYTAATVAEAFKIAELQQPEVILLDLGLPDMNGATAISRFLQISTASIIIISAQDEIAVKVNALDSGADDFIVKPFNYEEVMARVRVAIRRNLTASAKNVYPVISDGYLTIDLDRRYVERGGERVKLTPLEYNLLATLAGQKDRLLTRRQLLQKVWGKYAEETDILRTTLKQLRRKIEPNPANPIYIITEGRTGYRFIFPHENVNNDVTFS
jgi:two-component system, OmpR family, KDP operon response regulator KdpE